MNTGQRGAAADARVVVDDVDKRIIEQLQQDGRRPFTQMAPAVGLSEAAVRHRVQRLVDAGVVHIVGVTDPAMVGFGRQALVGLGVEGDSLRVADTLAAMDEVVYVVLTAGSLDVLAEVVVKDDEHLLALLNDKIRAIDGVRHTETFVYLRIHKETYAWGTA